MAANPIDAQMVGLPPGWYVFDKDGLRLTGPHPDEATAEDHAADSDWVGQYDSGIVDISYAPDGIGASPAPPVRKFLDLSTGHLPEDIGSFAGTNKLTSIDGVNAYELDLGYLLWVPPDDHADNEDERDVPPEVAAIYRHARSLGCDYVMFDADGPTINELPTWEW